MTNETNRDGPAATEPRRNGRLFRLGMTMITPNAQASLDHADVADALERHATGDWGIVCKSDADFNEEALRQDARILSAYLDRNGTKFWIITEWDRSVTTVLLPEDY